jgi:hypothetical protein
MHPQRAVLVQPIKLEIDDKIPFGRGPWAKVRAVKKMTGRPPKTGPNVEINTKRGRLVVPAHKHIRVVRAKTN